MLSKSDRDIPKRRAISLSIREDVIEEAKSLDLDASKAVEEGLVQAIRKAQTAAWIQANKKAFRAHNERVDESGTFLKPRWDVE